MEAFAALCRAINEGNRFALGQLADLAEERGMKIAPGLRTLWDHKKWPHIVHWGDDDPTPIWATFWRHFENRPESNLPHDLIPEYYQTGKRLDEWQKSASGAILAAAMTIVESREPQTL